MTKKPSETPAIEIENLDFRFNGGPPVLEQVNLSVAAGDFASVIGPNGGGKTTLLNLIGALDTATGGAVEVWRLPPHPLDRWAHHRGRRRSS